MAGLRRFGVRYALGTKKGPKPHTAPSTLKSKRCSLSGAKKKADRLRDWYRLRLLRALHQPHYR